MSAWRTLRAHWRCWRHGHQEVGLVLQPRRPFPAWEPGRHPDRVVAEIQTWLGELVFLYHCQRCGRWACASGDEDPWAVTLLMEEILARLDREGRER